MTTKRRIGGGFAYEPLKLQNSSEKNKIVNKKSSGSSTDSHSSPLFLESLDSPRKNVSPGQTFPSPRRSFDKYPVLGGPSTSREDDDVFESPTEERLPVFSLPEENTNSEHCNNNQGEVKTHAQDTPSLSTYRSEQNSSSSISSETDHRHKTKVSSLL